MSSSMQWSVSKDAHNALWLGCTFGINNTRWCQRNSKLGQYYNASDSLSFHVHNVGLLSSLLNVHVLLSLCISLNIVLYFGYKTVLQQRQEQWYTTADLSVFLMNVHAKITRHHRGLCSILTLSLSYISAASTLSGSSKFSKSCGGQEKRSLNYNHQLSYDKQHQSCDSEGWHHNTWWRAPTWVLKVCMSSKLLQIPLGTNSKN